MFGILCHPKAIEGSNALTGKFKVRKDKPVTRVHTHKERLLEKLTVSSRATVQL